MLVRVIDAASAANRAATQAAATDLGLRRHPTHRFGREVEPLAAAGPLWLTSDEVIAHLTGQVGAQVTVTLEIEAHLPDGASAQIVRSVTENSWTLKLGTHGFEKE